MLETVLIILGVTVYFGGVRIQALSLTSVCFSLCNDQYLCLLSENNNTELLELFSGINEIHGCWVAREGILKDYADGYITRYSESFL